VLPKWATNLPAQRRFSSLIEYGTQFRTAQYHRTCIDAPGNVDTDYKARSNGWIGGNSNNVTETSPPATNSADCASFAKGKGSYFLTQNEQAKTWTASLGLDIQGIGFQGTAQTGYDSSTTLKYDFANAAQTN
jgi:hypothetical protein